MLQELIGRVIEEEKVAKAKWGYMDRTPNDLLNAATEELGEVAHAINHDEGKEAIQQEIVETVGVLARLWEMVD